MKISKKSPLGLKRARKEMLTKITTNVPVVSAIVERRRGDITELLMQERQQSADPEYSGTLEIPAGWMEKYENVFDALRREVKEETGLSVTKVFPDFQADVHSPQGNDAAFAFNPFCVVQMLKGGLPWVSNVFLCEVEDGDPVPQEGEVGDITWMDRGDVRKMLEESPEKIFTLQVPALDYYFQALDKGRIE